MDYCESLIQPKISNAMVSWFLLTVRRAERGEKFLGVHGFLVGFQKKVHKPQVTPPPKMRKLVV